MIARYGLLLDADTRAKVVVGLNFTELTDLDAPDPKGSRALVLYVLAQMPSDHRWFDHEGLEAQMQANN